MLDMMLQKFWKYVTSIKKRIPLLYSISLVIIVPLTLVANTWWNLHSFERDMDFAVRDKALAVQNVFTSLLQNQSASESALSESLVKLQAAEPSLVAARVLIPTEAGQFKTLASTDETTEIQDEKLLLNQMSWSQEESYFEKIYDLHSHQNVWMVISPFYNREHSKAGLVNFKVSTSAIDSVVDRTARDALIIMGVSTIAVVLLLINHLRFFEQALLVSKLQQIDKMKDDFISVASHELKTPLTAIRGCVSMIRENFKDSIPSQLSDWFSIIDSSVDRLNNLVNDLLNVSRIEQNRLGFLLTAVNSTDIITEVVRQLQFPAQEKGLQLCYEASPEPYLVQAQPDRLREVLINLVGNAIKYTLEGKVVIRQTTEGKSVRLIIQDTGIGIAPEDKEKLFQKFSRVYNEKTQDVPGSGLGLWITKAMVERMQGKIYVDSVLGQGTVFTVVFKSAVL